MIEYPPTQFSLRFFGEWVVCWLGWVFYLFFFVCFGILFFQGNKGSLLEKNPIRNGETEIGFQSTSAVIQVSGRHRSNTYLLQRRTTEVWFLAYSCGQKRDLQEADLSSCLQKAGNTTTTTSRFIHVPAESGSYCLSLVPPDLTAHSQQVTLSLEYQFILENGSSKIRDGTHTVSAKRRQNSG